MSRPLITAGWPLEAFVGDILVCTLEGAHLDAVTEIKVAPAAKGIQVRLGDPLGRAQYPVQQSSEALTVTVEIGFQVYPGEKRMVVVSPAGESDPLPFLVMM
ncbi:MAG: hypothetical protein NW237_02885 [Cyanobacteriota bacterium]|nr:hypothetical protein [Cyanobacteriota bacterium]